MGPAETLSKKKKKKKAVVHLRQVANMQQAVEMVGFLSLN